MMRHGSLFSGIGGFDLAAEWMGWENVFHCEINKFCQKILNQYWPKAKLYEDIKSTDFSGWRGTIDIISGGFPCQPFSVAGKRRGKNDDRFLWPEMLRAIREVRPLWIVGENTPSIKGMVLDQILDELEAENYKAEAFDIPAGAVGSDQYRYRTWIVAYADLQRCGAKKKEQIFTRRPTAKFHSWRRLEPSVGRVAYGIPRQMDRGKGLGNAIHPGIAYEIFKAIEAVNDTIYKQTIK